METHGSIETGIQVIFWLGNARSWLGNRETAIKIFHEFWRYLFETDFQLCLRWCCTLTHKTKEWRWTTLQIWGCHPDDQASGLLYEHWSGLWIVTDSSLILLYAYFWMMQLSRLYIVMGWIHCINRIGLDMMQSTLVGSSLVASTN